MSEDSGQGQPGGKLGITIGELGVILLACGFMVLVLMIGFGLYGRSQSGSPGKTAEWTGGSGGCDLTFSGNVAKASRDDAVKAIADYLNKKTNGSSPLISHAGTFYDAGKTNGVNPAFMVAISGAESTFGTKGTATNNLANPFGYGPSNDFKNGSSLDAGLDKAINTVTAAMKNNYLNDGKTTIELVQAKYAGVGVANDPTNLNANWATNVTSFMNEIQSDASTVFGGMCQSAASLALANFNLYYLQQPSGSVACATTSIAMCINYLLQNPKLVDAVTAWTMYQKGQLAQWGSPTSVGPSQGKVQEISLGSPPTLDKIQCYLKANIPVIVGANSGATGFTTSTHYVVVIGIAGSNFVIADPAHPDRHEFSISQLLLKDNSEGSHVYLPAGSANVCKQ